MVYNIHTGHSVQFSHSVQSSFIQCTMCLSPLKGVNQRFEPDLYHCPHFEAVSLFQTKYLEIASCAVSLLNDIWVRVEHSLLQKLKSVAVQAVYRQDVNKMWGRVEHLPEKSASNILAMKKIRKIFVFFKFHFHNDGRPREKINFRYFFSTH